MHRLVSNYLVVVLDGLGCESSERDTLGDSSDVRQDGHATEEEGSPASAAAAAAATITPAATGLAITAAPAAARLRIPATARLGVPPAVRVPARERSPSGLVTWPD